MIKFDFNFLNLKIVPFKSKRRSLFVVASVLAIRQSKVICGLILKRSYLALYVFFYFSLQAIIVISKKRVNVLVQGLFTCVRKKYVF